MENYLVAMAVSAGIYALMALGMNVIWGMAGLINLGLVGFFAVGAYISALLTSSSAARSRSGSSPAPRVAARGRRGRGAGDGAAEGRLSGDRHARLRRDDAHRGESTRSGSPTAPTACPASRGRSARARTACSSTCFYLCLVAALVTVLFVLVDRLSHSPFARVLRAIREDEQVAAVAGKHVIDVQGEGVRVRQRGARARRRALWPLHLLHRARHLRSAAHPLHQARAAGRRRRQQPRRGASAQSSSSRSWNRRASSRR